MKLEGLGNNANPYWLNVPEIKMAAKEGKCQICGEVKALTRDHIPQLSLYPKSIRPDVPKLNTVLACADCNNSACVVDEILKVFVGLVADAPWRSEMNDSIDSTLSNNRGLARLLEKNTRLEVKWTPKLRQ